MLGLSLGWLGWGEVVLGLFLGFLYGAVIGIVLIATELRARKSQAVPVRPVPRRRRASPRSSSATPSSTGTAAADRPAAGANERSRPEARRYPGPSPSEVVRVLRYLTAGESHGPALTVVVEGLPAGLPVTVEQIGDELARRRLGFGRGPADALRARRRRAPRRRPPRRSRSGRRSRS